MATGTTPERVRTVGWVLVAAYVALVVTAPLNPLLEARFVFLGFLVLVIALGVAMTVYGVHKAWPVEVEILPGTDEQDRKRQEELELHVPD